MKASIQLNKVSLSIPLFLQQERQTASWASVLTTAIFDPPHRQLAHVLHEVSLDIRDGDRVALLGRNGAGKSTLLKLINGIYVPTTGNIKVNGSRQGLLNMSLGFSQEATVRENIFLRGTAMGLEMDFLRNKADAILEFAGLRDKVNHRLRTLSSGQKMRLGFSISTSVRQDILLMDEWVGASDANFMAKAKKRLLDQAHGSRIVILATHTIALLHNICNKGLIMDEGRVHYFGDLDHALKEYKQVLANQWMEDAARGQDKSLLGYVDHMRLDEGRLHLKGWMTGVGGGRPAHLVIEINGRPYDVSSLRWHARPDVARKFGLRDERCGFKAVFDIGDNGHIKNLHGQLIVLAGMDSEVADTELKLAPRVKAELAASGHQAAGA